jgi:hypothetical protein
MTRPAMLVTAKRLRMLRALAARPGRIYAQPEAQYLGQYIDRDADRRCYVSAEGRALLAERAA